MADPQPIPPPDPLTEAANFFASTEAGRANGRAQLALLQNQQDALRNQQFTQGSTNARDQATFQLGAPGVRASQAVRGDILANAKDASISGLPSYIHVPTISGGLRPSMFSDATRQFGAGLSRNALLSQLNGGDKINFPTAPGVTPLPSASALDSLLNGAAGATGGAKVAKDLAQGGSGGDLGKLFAGAKNLFSGNHADGTFGTPGEVSGQSGNPFGNDLNPEDPLNSDPSGIYHTGGETDDPAAIYQAWLDAHPNTGGGADGESVDPWDDQGAW